MFLRGGNLLFTFKILDIGIVINGHHRLRQGGGEAFALIGFIKELSKSHVGHMLTIIAPRLQLSRTKNLYV